MFNTMKRIKERCVRSRFVLFNSSIENQRNGKERRCREPSRLPFKQMRLYLKKRKLRKTLRNYALKNIPKTSKVYDITQSKLLRKVVIFSNIYQKTIILQLLRETSSGITVKCFLHEMKWCIKM